MITQIAYTPIKKLARWAKEYVVLEIGCGIGGIMYYLAPLYKEIQVLIFLQKC